MAIKRLTIHRLNGTEITVTPNLVDSIAFEAYLRKDPRRGGLQENMLTMQPFRAWNAGRRDGTVTDGWEDFLANTASVEVIDDDGAPAEDEVELGGVTGAGLDTPTAQPTSY